MSSLKIVVQLAHEAVQHMLLHLTDFLFRRLACFVGER